MFSRNPRARANPDGLSSDSNSRASHAAQVRSAAPPRPGNRVKIREAREIITQSPDLALKDGELDLQAFLHAQQFQIRALEESMRHTKSESTSRAFQQVPRDMRRRAASHNAKRVPKRLRQRALREMREENTPTVAARRRKLTTTRARLRAYTARKLGILAEKKRKRRLKAAREKAAAGEKPKDAGIEAGEGPKSAAAKPVTVISRPPRPKIRRNQLNDPPKLKSKFRKRQVHKTWLPTHLWHAKRARMTDPKTPLWRFALPLTPNQKIYRATHRAQGDRGTLAWDVSYMSTIGLYGNERGVEQVLRKLGVVHESCWNDKGRKWRRGVRHWTGFLSRETKDAGRRHICPATILWNPAPEVPADTETHAQQEEPNENSSPKARKVQRQLFIRVHPSAFLELFNELLRLTRMQNPRLYIEDLRFEIGSIDITGPGSTETLLGILHAYYTDPERRECHAEVFSRLTSLTNPSSAPVNSLLAFSVLDPRLRYPPQRVCSDMEEAQNDALLDLLARWPTEEGGLKPYDIFDRNARFNASHLPSQKSVDRRKGAKAPGTRLEASAADPPIPILLLASRQGRGTQVQGTWTILAPFKCIQPIWYGLVHFPLQSGGNPRFAGLNEARQVAFERGVPCFPFDYPGTDAGAEWEVEQRAKRRRDWERRPKSKRPAWESIELGAGRKGEVGDGLACDLEHVLGLKEDEPSGTDPQGNSMELDQVTEEETSTATAVPSADALKRAQLISKDMFASLLNNGPSTTTTTSSSTLPPNPVITISITLINRGVADPCARIYRLPSRPQPPPPSSSAEVPPSSPPPQESQPADNTQQQLPSNLRDQWLSHLPTTQRKTTSHHPSHNRKPNPSKYRPPPNADLETRKRLLAQSLLDVTTATDPFNPSTKPNTSDLNGHPLVPDEADLIGFVTTGAFSLSEGKGMAIGCVSAVKAAEARNEAKGMGYGGEGWLCIVRNAGEGVGRLARWEVV